MLRLHLCKWVGHQWQPCFTNALNTGFYFACRRCGNTVSPALPMLWLELTFRVVGHSAYAHWLSKYREDLSRRAEAVVG